MTRLFFIVITVVSLSLSVNLIFERQANANEETPYAEIARLRQYPGGADESDLKVQPELNQDTAIKKKKPVKVEPNEGF